MGNATIISGISEIIDGALYFSESENPFTVSDWGQVDVSGLTAKIASEQHAEHADLKQTDTSAFFQRITNSTDPTDNVLTENAAKLQKLQQYLNNHLTDIQVTRVEGSSRIPVIITGYLPDNTCIAIQTVAIET
jgi:hypothetical protein